MNFIGLDIGTTGCKAAIVNSNGGVVSYSYEEYDMITPFAGGVELNAESIWLSVCTVLSKLMSDNHCEVSAISIASFGEALVFVDEDDSVLDNSILFSDIRGVKELDDILSRIEQNELEQLTGMPVNPMYSLNKLLWVMKHKPEVYQKAVRIMLFGDFFTYKLCGEAVIDYSLASRTMLFDVTGKVWADRIFDAFDISKHKFSRTVPSGTVIGRIHEAIASSLHLSDSLLVIAGGHDQACAALGAGVLQIGDAVDGVGTSECITAIVEESFMEPAMYGSKYCYEPHVCGNKYITLAFNATAGAVIKWYKNTFENFRADSYSNVKVNFYDQLNKECPDDPTSLLLLPHFAGSGTPYMDPYSCGALVGLKLDTTKAEIYKAILEGLCFEMKINMEMLLRWEIPIDEIVAVGGGAQSGVLLQIKADVTGKPVKTLRCPESGVIGLAVLCSVACGCYANIETAVKEMVHVKHWYEPRHGIHSIYQERYELYKRLYPAIKSILVG